MRSAKLKSLAKINLDLRILNKREDAFHELRTVFQTISLSDEIEICYVKSRKTTLKLAQSVEIDNNLILRAADAVLHAAKTTGTVHFKLKKKIPMGGGLGGGSSNAAAILLALPVLIGREVPVEEIAASLGSDVPYFLDGGTSVALGRGTELYPLRDLSEQPVLVIASGLHVATGPAYAALGRGLTFTESSNKINAFQAFVRALGDVRRADLACASSENDFEAVVFRQFPKLKQIRAKLSKVSVARMTGSGSAIFGLFESVKDRERARKVLERDGVFEGCELLPASLVSRKSYRRMWRRQLREHIVPGEGLWPLQSRYAR